MAILAASTAEDGAPLASTATVTAMATETSQPNTKTAALPYAARAGNTARKAIGGSESSANTAKQDRGKHRLCAFWPAPAEGLLMLAASLP